MKWFGEPWPSPELRAAVCEDDNQRVPVPVGQECTLCTEDIQEGDQGVILAHLSLSDDGQDMTRVDKRAAHLACLVRGLNGNQPPVWHPES